jgi:nucleoside-diphosphate-sugar epimerase
MRVFLTGANGYVGRVLGEQLARLPEITRITGIGRTHPPAPLPDKFKFIRLDIRSPDLAATMVGHDAVIHTACIVHWPAKMPVQERDDINLDGTRNVARAAAANRIRRFIHASCMAVYDPVQLRGKSDVAEDFPTGKGNSPYYYWNAKAMAEAILVGILDSCSLLTFFRPAHIAGPRNHAMVASYQKNAVRFPGRNPRRQFIHEADLAAAFIQALFQDMPGAFNVVPDDYLHMADVWKIAGAKFVPTIPLPLARLIASVRWRFLGSTIHASWVEDMLIDFTGSNAKLKQAGWKPRFTGTEALRSAAEVTA